MNTTHTPIPRLPVFLLAFANNYLQPQAHLTELEKELAQIQGILNRSEVYVCEVVPSANLPRIIQLLSKYKRHVHLFHYSGHAYEEGLELNAELAKNRTAFTKGIVDLIKLSEGVKMVFLNGCFTEKQMQQYHKAGVEIIIGTTHQIKDHVATEFSIAFYGDWVNNGSTIEHAFQTAESVIRAHYQEASQIYKRLEAKDNSAQRDRMNVHENSSSIQPYKLSVSKEAARKATLKQWEEEFLAGQRAEHQQKAPSQSQQESTLKPIHPKVYQRCNRKKQIAVFEDCIQRQINMPTRKPSFYVVFGPQEELPDSFVSSLRTFSLEEIYSAHGKKVRIGHKKVDFPDWELLKDRSKVPPLEEHERYKQAYYMAFSQLLGNYRKSIGSLGGLHVNPDNIMKGFGNRVDIAIIEHRITIERWQPDMRSFFRAYIQDFWLALTSERAVQPIIIFSIGVEGRDTFLRRLGWQNPLTKIGRELDKLVQEVHACTVLQELTNVSLRDVRDWQRNNLMDQPELVNDIFHLKHKEKLPMAQVQPKLKSAVEAYLEQWRKEDHIRKRMTA